MEWVEVAAKTIEDAKETALDHLGVDESMAEFEIVDEPKTGWFGRLKVEARVRARVRPTQPRPKTDRRRRRGSEGSSKGRSNKGRSSRRDNRSSSDRSTKKTSKPKRSKPAATTPAPGRPEHGSGKPDQPKDRAEPATPASAAKQSTGSPAESDRSENKRAKRASTKRGGVTNDRTEVERTVAAPSGPRVAAIAASDAKPRGGRDLTKKPTATGEAMQEEVTVEEQADIVWGFLEGLLDAFDVDGEINQTTIDEDTVELSVLGDDLGLLIGPKGNTLQAIQELSRTAVQRQVVSAPGRVRLDVAQYREKRREALSRFVTVQAEETREAGVQRALEPMNAADRKVVHDTVNEIDGVHTISEGQDPNRRVVIIPDGE